MTASTLGKVLKNDPPSSFIGTQMKQLERFHSDAIGKLPAPPTVSHLIDEVLLLISLNAEPLRQVLFIVMPPADATAVA